MIPGFLFILPGKFSIMKHIIGYAVLLVLIGILFYLHFGEKKNNVNVPSNRVTKVDSSSTATKIAYINIDTLQNNYKYYQQIKSELNNQEKSAENQLMLLQKKFQNRTAELQQKAPQMSPKEQEGAMMEINKMQQDFQAKQQSLHENLAEYNQKMKDKLLARIEDYLKVYNNNGKYSYVFSYEPGFMFYKDSTLDITAEVVKGLNELFEKEKK